jgi:phosphomannomutase
MITASHNPPEWNGFKIKESFGGSARPEFTKKVENNIGQKAPETKPNKIEALEPRIEYLKYIQNFVDMDLIKRSGIRIALNPMFGSALGYLSSIIKMDEVNGYRDPLFGGLNPEPIPVNLVDFTSYMQEMGLKYEKELSVGIVLDGDGDRIGAVDPSGAFISSHNVFSLLLYHLFKNRKMTGKVVKTFNITRLVEKQCKKFGLPLAEVPIGFKYIADIMLKEKVLIGGEESGGMGIQGNIPERDGSLCALLLLELMATEKKTLKQILDSIMDELGRYYYDRIDLHTEKKSIGRAPQQFAGQKVVKVEDLDGTKLNFEDGAWILFRPSGTEPLLRIYAEANDPERVKKLLAEGENLVNRS